MPTPRTTQITNLFHKIDINLTKFYSSRPQPQPQLQPNPTNSHHNNRYPCLCKIIKKQKSQEISFYKQQKQIISHTAEFLANSDIDDDAIFGKILGLVVEYIGKIVELLGRDEMCQCRKDAIAEALVLRHKVNFMREQNDKFFKFCQQKSLQCQQLTKQLQTLKASKPPTPNLTPTPTPTITLDLIPITARLTPTQNKQNQQPVLSQCGSQFQFTEKQSLGSSNISMSQNLDIAKVETHEMMQNGHNKYFNLTTSKKYRRTMLFQ